MNLRTIAASARETIFKLTESVEVTGTYYHIVGGAYNVTTGAASVTTTTFSCSARTGVFEQKEIDGESIKAGDKKLFFKTTEVTVKPGSNDYFVDSAGVRWDLMEIGTEPTDSILILRGRAHSK